MKERAFTLVELLVVTAIILVLTALILPNFREIGKGFSLQRSANKLAQNIRRAQQMAISSKEFKGQIPEGGYGIYLKEQPEEIILFADCNDNQQYNLGNVCGTPPNKFSEKIEDIDLEKEVQIKSLSPSPLNIVFTPPDPIVTITSNSQASITICLETDSTKTKTIGVNKAGLIYVE